MSSSKPNEQPPAKNELEITIFGPGVGECIVLHLGNDDWMVVDSCILPDCAEPAALNYLRRIGVDPAKSVRRVLATHWHDDHIQGLAKVLTECSNAQFVMSGALSGPQFIQLVLEVEAQNRLVKHTSSASEFAEILKILKDRAVGRYVVGPNIYAQDGLRIFQGGHNGTMEVWALSPSSATVTNSLAHLADRLMTPGEAQRFKRFSPNDLSVAILVQTVDFHLLLGADLENTNDEQFGWKAVLKSALRPQSHSTTFKVAHHGSVNADHEDVWKRMLVEQPLAVVTPFAKLSKPLPTKTDAARIKDRAGQAICTTWPPSKKPPRRKGVDGIVRGATKSRTALNRKSGYVRLRLDLSNSGSQPKIEMFGSAKQL